MAIGMDCGTAKGPTVTTLAEELRGSTKQMLLETRDFLASQPSEAKPELPAPKMANTLEQIVEDLSQAKKNLSELKAILTSAFVRIK